MLSSSRGGLGVERLLHKKHDSALVHQPPLGHGTVYMYILTLVYIYANPWIWGGLFTNGKNLGGYLPVLNR